ncbi:MAG: hypothetical protein JRF04_04845, partial [Deltaproteobacteria bacterium]|nr:hypothetical protein [Deltaproteobacteria bacterium]
DTGKENGLYDRDVLLAINTLTEDLEQFKQDDLFVGFCSLKIQDLMIFRILLIPGFNWRV